MLVLGWRADENDLWGLEGVIAHKSELKSVSLPGVDRAFSHSEGYMPDIIRLVDYI